VTRYTGIRSEGGLLPYDLLEKIASGEAEGQKPADFGLPKGRRLSDEIQRVWSDAQDLWDIFQRRKDSLPEKDPYGTTLTRERWIVPLLGDPQILAYDLKFQPSAVTLDGLSFPISHFAGEPQDSPPIHIEGCNIDIDRRAPKLRTSPQAIVQEFLNHSERHLWGIVTNGLSLRLLRDTARTARPSYLEFDLESILQGGLFNEFALFYRLCHRTRLPKPGQPPEGCLLEHYYQLSIEQGGRVRDKLRDGVEEALKILGTGFLRHPQNQTLREALASGRLKPADYHRQLLRLIYRLLFLIVAEERHLIVAAGENAERNQVIYRDCYSISRLRERAEGIVEESEFSDLWLGLKQTLWLFSDSHDTNLLGIPPLNGDLFSSITMPDLEETQLLNHHLLQAIRRLTLFQEDHVQQRVNYAALDVEELGSVYESLLDFRPMVLEEAEGWEFRLATGSERKTTGSYYTRPELVRELIQSALVPVIEDRLAEAQKQTKGKPEAEVKAAREKAILNIAVCDPACGSGHFLLEAARGLGRELARIRSGQDDPGPEDFHLAVRDAISHCIYGVDLNPLAVDLCKLALWLESHWVGKPLSFLDHRIKCGNSLIGVLDPGVLEKGIPDDAFTAVTGDDKKVASAYKKRNKKEREMLLRRFDFEAEEYLPAFTKVGAGEMDFPEDKPEDVRRKEELYQKVREQKDWLRDWTAANLWTSAFFVPLTKYDDPVVPTDEAFMDYLLHGKDRPQMTGYANALSVENHFFHWRLEFPTVFEKGGFDVVLGNPPWEKIQLEEEKFFAQIAPDVAAASAKKRKEAIRLLETDRPEIHAAFQTALRRTAAQAQFVKHAGRFPFSGEGNVSTHSLFIELATTIAGSHSRIGLVVPSGLATQDTQKHLFSALTSSGRLIRLLDFENRLKLFPSVHAQFRFCLVTIGPPRPHGAEAEFAFLLQSTNDIRQPKRSFRLSYAELCRFSPNTISCPQLVNEAEASLLRKIYTTGRVIYREDPQDNAWGWQSWQVFNETHEADLLIEDPAVEDALPLYEGKLFYQFDHRYATYLTAGEVRYLSSSDKERPGLSVRTRYSVSKRIWSDRIATDGYKARWILAFRRITNATNERTAIFSILPKCITGSQSPAVKTKQDAKSVACLLANLNSTVFDFAARRRVGGTDLNHFIIHQLPVITPSDIALQFPIADKGETVCDWLLPRVLELTYTAWDLEPFAQDCGWETPAFCWNEERRFLLRCELDAAFFHLYLPADKNADWLLVKDEAPEELSRLRSSFPRPRDAVAYIMDTFPIVRRKDEEEYADYRTKRSVLEIYDRMQHAIFSGVPYQTALDPPPADARVAHLPHNVKASHR
jgi:Eco57I restriction-modification methylase